MPEASTPPPRQNRVTTLEGAHRTGLGVRPVGDTDLAALAFLVRLGPGDVEVYRSAQRADAMLEKGCLDGQRVWMRVLKEIKEIQRRAPREGEAVN